MKGVKIEYGGIAVGAKESFIPKTSDKAEFVDLDELRTDAPASINFGNPCDMYSVILDGNTAPIPEDHSEYLGWWSDQISGDDGTFEDPVVLSLTSDKHYSSSGFTFTFDTLNDVYATDITIEWYDGVIKIESADFSPDSAFYFCSKPVSGYNRAVITFRKINMPYNRLRVASIEYGMMVTFYGDELRKCKLIQEIDPISSQIAINTCDFTVESKRNIEYPFQERQPVSVYFNDELRSTSFVTNATRKSKTSWDVKTEDYIGIMEGVVFPGGMYTDKPSGDLLDEIFTAANVPYTFPDGMNLMKVSGYIPYTNCRDALMQVSFVLGAIVDTSNSASVDLYFADSTETQKIPLNRIMQGQNFDESKKVTAVEVTAHEYIPNQEETVLYSASDSGSGNDIFVKFSEPMHSLSITAGSEMVEFGTNYAVINANSNCELKGKKYTHQKTVRRADLPNSETAFVENVVGVDDATLASPFWALKLCERLSKHYSGTMTIKAKIVEGAHIVRFGEVRYGNTAYRSVADDPVTKVGDMVECSTGYLGTLKGRIIKQTFSLNGNSVVKDSLIQKTITE